MLCCGEPDTVLMQHAVAVLAFEAVIELEMTRRENDRRVTVLFVEMKEVMTVVTQ